MKCLSSINILFIIIFSIFPCKSLNNSSLSDEKEKEIVTIKSDDEEAIKEATFYLWKLGGYIYIDTPVITLTQGSLSITGTLEGGIIGIKQPNGEYPRLNFKKQRDASTFIYTSGIDVVGSNKKIQNIIVEYAGTFGIFINGQKNTIDHVITRYNGKSGIYISQGSYSINFNYCYSYRNFLLPKNTRIADGFSIEFGAFDITFKNCFAWDNSHNGFGYHYTNGKSMEGGLSYHQSGSWNNGNMDVFSGKYDFDNGKEFDKKLWTVQEILKSDTNFEKNYKNEIFNLKNAKINNISAEVFLIDYFKEDYGNGFTFGNEKNEKDSNNRRTVEYCVSFDHKSKGYNNNKSQNFTGSFTNNVGFNNYINYELPYSFSKWNNVWGWNSNAKDKLDPELNVKIPKDMKSAQKNFYSVRDKIIDVVNANKFPNINFNNVIRNLNE